MYVGGSLLSKSLIDAIQPIHLLDHICFFSVRFIHTFAHLGKVLSHWTWEICNFHFIVHRQWAEAKNTCSYVEWWARAFGVSFSLRLSDFRLHSSANYTRLFFYSTSARERSRQSFTLAENYKNGSPNERKREKNAENWESTISRMSEVFNIFFLLFFLFCVRFPEPEL